MITSFRDRDTERLWRGETVRRLAAIAQQALPEARHARVLSDLRAPPGNRLEALRGNRTGQHSIRVNDQWRICFVWSPEGAENVEIVDYH